jgi:hypothetical protein
MTQLTAGPEDAGRLLRRSGGLAEAIVHAADAAAIVAIVRTHLTPHRDAFESPLRRFAWHCAQDVAHFTRGPAHLALLEAGRLAAGLGTSSYLLAARDAARADADAARSVGMARCEPSAAAFLAAYHSCAANVFDAAREAAECAAKVAFFRQARISAQPDSHEGAEPPWNASRRVAEWLKSHRSEVDGAEREMKRRQADVLRALLGLDPARVLPFAPSLLPRVRTVSPLTYPSSAPHSHSVQSFCTRREREASAVSGFATRSDVEGPRRS